MNRLHRQTINFPLSSKRHFDSIWYTVPDRVHSFRPYAFQCPNNIPFRCDVSAIALRCHRNWDSLKNHFSHISVISLKDDENLNVQLPSYPVSAKCSNIRVILSTIKFSGSECSINGKLVFRNCK